MHMKNILSDISQAVGSTPLVRLNSISDNSKANVYGKIESVNPLFCVKDRIGKIHDRSCRN